HQDYDSKRMITELKRLKALLIILTIVKLFYIIVSFFYTTLWVIIDLKYNLSWFVWGFHYMIVGIFIWYIWKRMPVEKKVKTDNTLLVLFLGVIGMWLWLPNKKEREKLL